MKRFLKLRSAKRGMMTAGTIALFLIAVILCNIIVTLLVDHFDWKVDITNAKLYEISDNTRDFLKGYEQDATIYVLEEEQTFKTSSKFTAQAYYVLNNMVSCNDKLHLCFVDLDTNPDFYSRYPDDSLSSGGILVVNAQTQRHQFLKLNDLVSTTDTDDSQSSQYQVLSMVEQKVAHALEYTAGSNPIHAAILQGHQETSLAAIETLFNENNYVCEEVNLLTGTISQDTDFVMIAAPMVDYTEEEIAKLEAFLEEGGNLGKTIVYFASSGQPALPHLQGLLSKWGIAFEEGSVLETDTNHMLSTPFDTYVDAVSSDYTKNVSNMDLPILSPYIKGMKQVDPADSSISLEEFISTSDTCALRPQNAGEDWNYRSVQKQSYPVALAAKKTNEQTQKSSHVIGFASVQLLAYLDEPTLNNEDVLISSIGIAVDKPSKVYVEPKTLTKPSLGITSAQAGTIGFLFMFILPLGIAVAGVVVWTRRKNR